MNDIKDKSVSWVAPILPSVSMAGIELGMSIEKLSNLLSFYEIDTKNNLYKFEMSPILKLVRSNSNEDEIYLFSVYDKDLTNWRLYFNRPDHAGVNPRALGIVVRNGKVFSVKAWHFEKLKDGDGPKNIYRGKLPGSVGLGDPVSNLLLHTKLTYDDAEEVFYTDLEYGALEVTGYGDLNEYPDQVILAIAVVAEYADRINQQSDL